MENQELYTVMKIEACIRTAFRMIMGNNYELYEVQDWISDCTTDLIKEDGLEKCAGYLKEEISDFKDGDFYKYTGDWIGDNIMDCPGCGCKCLRYGGMCSDCAETSSVGGYDTEYNY